MKVKDKVIELAAAAAVATLCLGFVWLEVTFTRWLTPHLVDAIERMPFSEAVLAGGRTLGLWISLRVVSNPVLAAAFWLAIFALGCLLLSR